MVTILFSCSSLRRLPLYAYAGSFDSFPHCLINPVCMKCGMDGRGEKSSHAYDLTNENRSVIAVN